MYKISIIVPIYNVENYIDECINSIINQDYSNLEIILVDDGSKDNSGKICDEYAKKDKRIKIIHQNNLGLSSARNTGIEIATGEYIGFVDSDDYIYKDIYSFLMKKINKYDADIACCGYEKLYGMKIKKVFKNKKDVDLVMDNAEAISKIYYQQFSESYAWNKLYKRKLFNNIRYPVGKINEDIYTTYRLYDKSDRIVFNPSSKYIYRIRNGSITNQSFSLRSLDLIDGIDEMYNYCRQAYPSIIHDMDAGYVLYFLTVINSMIINDKINNEYVYRLKNFINKNYCYIIHNKYISNKMKLKIFLYKFDFLLYEKIYKMYNNRI